MAGLSSTKQDVFLRIETCSRSGEFQTHAEKSAKLIESWLDPTKFTLKTTISVSNPKFAGAFEVWVDGTLVHSDQQGNHGYLDSHPCAFHKEAVRKATTDCIAGEQASMPAKREDSEIKLDKQRMRQQAEDMVRKRREHWRGFQTQQKERVHENTLQHEAPKLLFQNNTKAEEKEQAQQEDAIKKEAAPEEKKQQAKEKTPVKRAQVDAGVDDWLQALQRRFGPGIAPGKGIKSQAQSACVNCAGSETPCNWDCFEARSKDSRQSRISSRLPHQ